MRQEGAADMAERRMPDGVNAREPNASRMYDYSLGGKDNFAADRAVVDELARMMPAGRAIPVENRNFLIRAVRFLVEEAGIRQFLDVGAGLPTNRNVHQVAFAAAPDSRVVYVDFDPVAVAHGRMILHGESRTVYLHEQARNVEAIVSAPETRQLLDFTKPIALLLVGVAYLIPDADDPVGIVHRFREHLAPGSYVAMSHMGEVPVAADMEAEYRETVAKMRDPFNFRSPEMIRSFFDGLDVVDPGIVAATRWRPDGAPVDPRWAAEAADPGWESAASTVVVGVGRVP